MLFAVEVLYSQNFGQTNNCVLEVFLKWLNQSCTPSVAPVFPKFGVCKTLHKIQIFSAKLKLKSLQNLDCARCFANSRFPKSEVCEIFCKVQIFSAKPQSKCIQFKIQQSLAYKKPPFWIYLIVLEQQPLFPQKLSVTVSKQVVSYM